MAIYCIINFMLELVFIYFCTPPKQKFPKKGTVVKVCREKKPQKTTTTTTNDKPFTSSVPELLDVPKWFLAKHVYLPPSDVEMLVMRSVPSSTIVILGGEDHNLKQLSSQSVGC